VRHDDELQSCKTSLFAQLTIDPRSIVLLSLLFDAKRKQIEQCDGLERKSVRFSLVIVVMHSGGGN
jgi:hypothetical protein